LIEGFMRALMVELRANDIKATLLRSEAARRRARGLGFQGAVHAFMAAVLRRPPGLDQFRQDPQAHPPRESVDNRAKVVVANGTPLSVRIRVGSPYSLNSRVKIGLAASTAVEARAWQPKEIAAEPIRHGQWVAVPAGARPEVPLVVGTPDIVGSEHLARRLPGMSKAAALASNGHHPMPAQDVARCGAARERPPRMALLQQGGELLAAPARVPAPGLEDRAHDLLGRLMRRAPRPARALLQAGRPVAQVAIASGTA
jgi:hypothetical protein